MPRQKHMPSLKRQHCMDIAPLRGAIHLHYFKPRASARGYKHVTPTGLISRNFKDQGISFVAQLTPAVCGPGICHSFFRDTPQSAAVNDWFSALFFLFFARTRRD